MGRFGVGVSAVEPLNFRTNMVELSDHMLADTWANTENPVRQAYGDRYYEAQRSSSGIGREVALKLSSLGANVVITGLEEDAIHEVVNTCQTLYKRKALGVFGDLTDDQFVKILVDKTIAEFSKIDILVNNAGILMYSGIENPEYMNIFDRIIRVNVRAMQVLTQLLVPYLVASNGCIVNTSSVNANKPQMCERSFSGIGREVALKLSSLGADVVITGLEEDGIHEVVNKCQTLYKRRAIGIFGDITDDQFVKSLVDKTIAEFNTIDILVNNAGICIKAGIENPDYMNTFDRNIRVNVRAMQVLTQLSVPYLVASNGCIVNTSSVNAYKPVLS
ncbi:unnamed protein product [Medioppia subpectinata]|uniref:Uncharacterized protein n=1 Tax=Medioppia subpectinata TaxID=1979941 RepID=A0A7R9L5N8_9ACAR|nr:unnamed protein product [Medioppia subpectinata]CAG2115820.1 unnamed protein product [Medioppia subpectinata]